MTRTPSPDFEPKRLSKVDVEAPMAAGLKRLSPKVRDTLHGRRRDLFVRTDPWSAPRVRRVGRYALGGAVLVPISAMLFWHFDGGSVLWMIPLSAVYGVLVAVLHPSPWLGGLLLWLFGIVFLVLDGQPPFMTGAGFVWFYHLAFIVLGTVVAIGEGLKAP